MIKKEPRRKAWGQVRKEKRRARCSAAWWAQHSHLLELLSSGDSKPAVEAEQASWQLDGLSNPTSSSYCQVETLNPLERQSKQLGSLMGSATPPSRAIVEQGRFHHWRHLLGFATPLYPSTGTIIIIFSTTKTKKKKKNWSPVPRILWFYVGTLCGLEHTLSLIPSSLLPFSAL